MNRVPLHHTLSLELLNHPVHVRQAAARQSAQLITDLVWLQHRPHNTRDNMFITKGPRAMSHADRFASNTGEVHITTTCCYVCVLTYKIMISYAKMES